MFLMCIVQYKESTFVTKLSSDGRIEDLLQAIKRKWDQIDEHMFLSYAIPDFPQCELSTNEDFENMFSMCELHKMGQVSITLGPRLASSIVSTGFSSSTMCTSTSTSTVFPSDNGEDDEFEDSIPIRMLERWRNCITGPNQFFYGGAYELRRELKKYSLCHCFKFKYQRNNKDRIAACCAKKIETGCGWKLYARSVHSSEVFFIVQFNGTHTCGVGSMTRTSTRMTSDIIADVVLEKMRLKPMYTAPEVRSDFQREYSFDLTYNQAWRGLQMARGLIYGEYKHSYNQLLMYTSAARESNPGSHIVFETEATTQRFLRLFMAFNACIEGFNYCRPILFVDATFLTGRYRGQLLSATAKDANNHLFPVAYAVVDLENTENWTWFMQQLRIALIADSRQFTFVSDRNQGILNAVSSTFPESPHGYCVYHLKGNLKKALIRYPAEMKEAIMNMFDKVIYCKTAQHFEKNMELLLRSGGKPVEAFIGTLEPQHYSHAYFPGLRYGECTSNAAESLNKKFVDQRQLPLMGLVDGMRKKIMTDMAEKKDLSSTWKFKICPVYDDLLREYIKKGQLWNVLKSSDTSYEVMAKKTVRVNLSVPFSCTCLGWQTIGFPCAHAVRAIMQSKLPIETFIDPYYHTDTFRETYRLPIIPIPTLFAEASTSTTAHVLPPVNKAQPGRPKNKRIRSANEPRRQLKCSKCRKTGHNSRSCGRDEE